MRELAFIQQLLPELSRDVSGHYAERAGLQVSSKADAVDLLTEVDLHVQRRIQHAIADTFGPDAIMAEEDGLDRPPVDPHARCWVLDPIDGTHNFVRGMVGAFGISIAFADAGQVQAAGVAFPQLGRTFTAARGTPTQCDDGSPANVSDVADIARAQVEMDFGRPDYRSGILQASPRLLQQAGQIRCHGSAVLGLCSVAAGHADAYLHGGLNTWDWAAAVLLIEQAGGHVTDLQGQPLQLFAHHTTALLATNTALHTAALDLISAPPPSRSHG